MVLTRGIASPPFIVNENIDESDNGVSGTELIVQSLQYGINKLSPEVLRQNDVKKCSCQIRSK